MQFTCRSYLPRVVPLIGGGEVNSRSYLWVQFTCLSYLPRVVPAEDSSKLAGESRRSGCLHFIDAPGLSMPSKNTAILGSSMDGQKWERQQQRQQQQQKRIMHNSVLMSI